MSWETGLAAAIARRLRSASSVTVEQGRAFGQGASNTTITLDLRVTCDGHEWRLPMVLRPERSDGVLAPYDIARQFRIMRALGATDVPIPAVAFHETSAAAIGAPFFLMERVAGHALPFFWYGEQRPEVAACAAALATVHAVEWRRLGLEPDLTPGETPVRGELDQWGVRAEHQGVAGLDLLLGLADWLARNEPAGTTFALLHGDPNPGNYILREGEVAAVVDWELAGLGDPRSDLGFYAALGTVFGGWRSGDGTTVFSEAYAAATGRTPDDLAYFEALGLYKMAVVMAGFGGRGLMPYFGMDAIERRLAVLLGPSWAT